MVTYPIGQSLHATFFICSLSSFQVYVTSPSVLCVCASPFTKRLAPSAKVSFSGLVMLAPLSNSMLSPLAIVKSSFKVAVPYTYVFVTVSLLVSASFHCFVITELLKLQSLSTGSGQAKARLTTIWLPDTLIG